MTMKKKLNEAWCDEMRHKASRVGPLYNRHIDETIAFSAASKWLVILLSELNIPFRVFSLGAGVKRITTDVDTCPCCKQKI